jgi:hypothetical protein
MIKAESEDLASWGNAQAVTESQSQSLRGSGFELTSDSAQLSPGPSQPVTPGPASRRQAAEPGLQLPPARAQSQ